MHIIGYDNFRGHGGASVVIKQQAYLQCLLCQMHHLHVSDKLILI